LSIYWQYLIIRIHQLTISVSAANIKLDSQL